jgi:hypothetical protein
LLERVGVFHIRQYGRAVDWNPTKGGNHQSIEAALESKLRLFRKYPGDVMLPSLEMIRYCHLDEATDIWRLGPLRNDVSVTAILKSFETWKERNGSREAVRL